MEIENQASKIAQCLNGPDESTIFTRLIITDMDYTRSVQVMAYM